MQRCKTDEAYSGGTQRYNATVFPLKELDECLRSLPLARRIGFKARSACVTCPRGVNPVWSDLRPSLRLKFSHAVHLQVPYRPACNVKSRTVFESGWVQACGVVVSQHDRELKV